MKRKPAAAQVAAALADPVRLQIMHRLLEGPASVAELVDNTGMSQPAVSNHLKVLRDRALVSATRRQRHILYALAGSEVGNLVESLLAVGGEPAARESPRDRTLAQARTCYDHLAGRLGVWLFDRLTTDGSLVLTGADRGDVGLGQQASATIARLGLDIDAAPRTRRRFAYACLDWTERRPHLGGSLGALLCERMLTQGWLVRLPGTRALRLTESGRGALASLGELPG